MKRELRSRPPTTGRRWWAGVKGRVPRQRLARRWQGRSRHGRPGSRALAGFLGEGQHYIMQVCQPHLAVLRMEGRGRRWAGAGFGAG